MLDIDAHDTSMKRILVDIYKHPQLQSQLVFKGGTCLYYFYDLPRFSTDLDFSLHRQTSLTDVDRVAITQIIDQHLEITADEDKRFTWLWVGRHQSGKQKVKVEISKRAFSDTYDQHQWYGTTVRTLDLASTFSHKLCAITDRKRMVNRDLFDSWWLLTKNAPIREEIIVERNQMGVGSYLLFVRKYIKQHANRAQILHGLGEVLDQSQKDWVRSHLLDELLVELTLRIEQTNEL